MDAGRAKGRGRGGRGGQKHRGGRNLSCFTVSSVIRTFRLENRYVFNSQREKTLLVMLLRSCGQTPLTAGSISPPTHNSSVFRCLQYSSVFFVYFSLILLKLNLPHCNVQYWNVQYCNVQYWLFYLLVVVKTCLLWNWIETANMKDCSVLYKVD